MNQTVLFITLSLIFIGVGFTLLAQQARIDDLQDQITNIQLIPGPRGEPGINGTQGPPGEPGSAGLSAGSGMCLDCRCPAGQYVTGFSANGDLICTGSMSSGTQDKGSGTREIPPDSLIISYETPVIPTATQGSATNIVSCDTIVTSGDMYYCSVECPSGIVQTSTIWINGQPGKFLSADSLDFPNRLTCYSEGPATCGATCV